jgi:hypothetical protein
VARRTLSRLLGLAALGSASGAATAEEQLGRVRDGHAVSKVRVRVALCADFLQRAAAQCLLPLSVSRPCTCVAVGRGRRERRAGRSGRAGRGWRGGLEARRGIGGVVVDGEQQDCCIVVRQSAKYCRPAREGRGLPRGDREQLREQLGEQLGEQLQEQYAGARPAGEASGVVSVTSREMRERERERLVLGVPRVSSLTKGGATVWVWKWDEHAGRTNRERVLFVRSVCVKKQHIYIHIINFPAKIYIVSLSLSLL